MTIGTPPRLRLAVAGAGLIGREHIARIESSSEADLCGIVDPFDGASDIARRHSVPLYPSLDALLAARPDGVILATPSPLHLDHALACIGAGVPVLVEKPIATTSQDGMTIAEAAEANQVPVLVGHHRRHSPILAAARDVISDGTLGRLVAVVGAALLFKPSDYFAAAPWRQIEGGGPILINLIHEVDAYRSLGGEIDSVQALVSSAIRSFPVEDTAAICFGFANGALGTFMLSDTAAAAMSWEHTSGENPRYPNQPDLDSYVIAGTGGSLGIPTMRLLTYGSVPSWWEPFERRIVDARRSDPLTAQLTHFCAVVRREVLPLVNARDALENVRVVEAVTIAARTGRTVHVAAPLAS